jgi:hypothetical protein
MYVVDDLRGDLRRLTSEQGYYFTASHEASQVDLAHAVARVMVNHGVIVSEEPKSLSIEEGKEILKDVHIGVHHAGLFAFGSSSRSRADRAVRCFDWKPTAMTVWETIGEDFIAWKTSKP